MDISEIRKMFAEDICRLLIRSAIKGDNTKDVAYMVDSLFVPDLSNELKRKEYEKTYLIALGMTKIYFPHSLLAKRGDIFALFASANYINVPDEYEIIVPDYK